MKTFKPRVELNAIENDIITQLNVFENDKNELIKHSIKNCDKVLAIAVYDYWKGSILLGRYKKTLICESIYKKLFNKNIETLFDADNDLFRNKLDEYKNYKNKLSN